MHEAEEILTAMVAMLLDQTEPPAYGQAWMLTLDHNGNPVLKTVDLLERDIEDGRTDSSRHEENG